MNFEELLICAKLGDDYAIRQILDMYRPMLLKVSLINGSLDDDLFQEQCLILMKCIEKFVI